MQTYIDLKFIGIFLLLTSPGSCKKRTHHHHRHHRHVEDHTESRDANAAPRQQPDNFFNPPVTHPPIPTHPPYPTAPDMRHPEHPNPEPPQPNEPLQPQPLQTASLLDTDNRFSFLRSLISSKPMINQRYVLSCSVGDGIESRVFEANDIHKGTNVALKIGLRKEDVQPRPGRRLSDVHDEVGFLRELAGIAGVPPVKNTGHFSYEYEGRTRELLFYETILLGKSIGDHISAVTKTDENPSPLGCSTITALIIFREILKSLKQIHLHNVAHTDLSYTNLLLDRNGKVFWIVDYGQCINFDPTSQGGLKLVHQDLLTLRNTIASLMTFDKAARAAFIRLYDSLLQKMLLERNIKHDILLGVIEEEIAAQTSYTFDTSTERIWFEGYLDIPQYINNVKATVHAREGISG